MSRNKPFFLLARLACCMVIMTVQSGCTKNSDEYVGDIEKVFISWTTDHGTNHVFILEPDKSGIYKPAHGRITQVSVQLTQFPGKRLVGPLEMAKKLLIHPEGEAVLSIKAMRVRFQCEKGSTNVRTISL